MAHPSEKYTTYASEVKAGISALRELDFVNAIQNRKPTDQIKFPEGPSNVAIAGLLYGDYYCQREITTHLHQGLVEENLSIPIEIDDNCGITIERTDILSRDEICQAKVGEVVPRMIIHEGLDHNVCVTKQNGELVFVYQNPLQKNFFPRLNSEHPARKLWEEYVQPLIDANVWGERDLSLLGLLP